jgi:nicotinate-nucleotide pyrophosphorylase (carboxylating)
MVDPVDEHVSQLIEMALLEDVGPGDVTSEYFVPTDRMARAFVLAKDEGVLAGVGVAAEVFRRVDETTSVEVMIEDGSRVAPGAMVMEVNGRARSLLTAERVALNFLQRLSGVATKTSRFVDAVQETGAVILDTRKTTPGWRALEKSAVRAGGGQNHRMGLYDRAMVKDNHLVAEGGAEALAAAIARLREERPGVEVEVEADQLDQAIAFLEMQGVDYLLLDNMDNEDMARVVEARKPDGPKLEASGGVNLDTVYGIAATGVDYVSVGAITHSAGALDLSLEFVEPE